MEPPIAEAWPFHRHRSQISHQLRRHLALAPIAHRRPPHAESAAGSPLAALEDLFQMAHGEPAHRGPHHFSMKWPAGCLLNSPAETSSSIEYSRSSAHWSQSVDGGAIFCTRSMPPKMVRAHRRWNHVSKLLGLGRCAIGAPVTPERIEDACDLPGHGHQPLADWICVRGLLQLLVRVLYLTRELGDRLELSLYAGRQRLPGHGIVVSYSLRQGLHRSRAHSLRVAFANNSSPC